MSACPRTALTLLRLGILYAAAGFIHVLPGARVYPKVERPCRRRPDDQE